MKNTLSHCVKRKAKSEKLSKEEILKEQPGKLKKIL